MEKRFLPVIDSSLMTQTSTMADAFLVLGFDGSRKACDWQTKTIAEELQGLASGITSVATPRVMTEYCRAATKFSQVSQADITGCRTRVVTLASCVVSVLQIAKDFGLSACGRAGNGIVYLSGEERIEAGELRERLTRLLDAGCGYFEFREQNLTVRHPVISSHVERYSKLLNELLG